MPGYLLKDSVLFLGRLHLVYISSYKQSTFCKQSRTLTFVVTNSTQKKKRLPTDVMHTKQVLKFVTRPLNALLT